MRMDREYVTFTGEETEIEFLKKLQKQWKIAANFNGPEVVKMMMLGGAFHEVGHRIDELEEN